MINQLSTKLPFSHGSQQTERNKNEMRVSDRVLAGLKPSQTNKTKALSKEQERIYSEILKSQDKNFQLILGENEEDLSELSYDNRQSNTVLAQNQNADSSQHLSRQRLKSISEQEPPSGDASQRQSSLKQRAE